MPGGPIEQYIYLLKKSSEIIPTMKGIILTLTVTLFAATSALYIPKIGTLVDCGLSGKLAYYTAKAFHSALL